MVRLAGRFTRLERRDISRSAAIATTGDAVCVTSISVSAGTSSSCRFATAMASLHSATRSRGSAQLVGRSAMMLDTRLVHGSVSSPVRMLTGTIARSGLSGSASCLIRYSRNAPAQMAITTSLTVPPVAFLSALMFSSDVPRMAKRRCAVIDLFHGVSGAGVNGNWMRRSLSPAALPMPATLLIASRAFVAILLTLVTPSASARFRTSFSCSRMPFTGFAARRCNVSCNSWLWLGGCSPSHSTAVGAGVFGSMSVSMFSRITPAAPSMVAWCVLVSIAHRPSARPSMTYTSHSGRERSIRRPTMRDTCSVSWSAPPGGARPM